MSRQEDYNNIMNTIEEGRRHRSRRSRSSRIDEFESIRQEYNSKLNELRSDYYDKLQRSLEGIR